MSFSQHVDAIADYNEAIRLKPDYVEVYFNRGNAKYSLGHHEKAITDYNEAIRLKPDYAEAYNNRGNAKRGLGQYERAINDYNEAIILKPDFALAYYNRGLFYLEINKPQEARRGLETARALAQQAGNDILTAAVDQELRNLDAPNEDE